MLNFIVLGYVPGTSLQITFTSFMFVVLVALLFATIYVYLMTVMIMHKARRIAAVRLVCI